MSEKKNDALNRYTFLKPETEKDELTPLAKAKSFLQMLWEGIIPRAELTPQQVRTKTKNRKKRKVVKASRKRNRRVK